LQQKHTKTALLKSESKKNGWERMGTDGNGQNQRVPEKRKTFETAEEIYFRKLLQRLFL
jgi:hypothetical protein